MKRLGMPVSDDTILRHLKRQVARLHAKTTVRVAGIDDWSWRKGRNYGTIIIDLERREVCRCAGGSHDRGDSPMAWPAS